MLSLSMVFTRSLLIAGSVVALLASGLMRDARAEAGDNAVTAPPTAQPQIPRPGQRGPGAQGQPAAQPAAPMMRRDTEAGASQLLDDTLADDPERIAKAVAKAAEAPPQTSDQQRLAQFYHQRAIEAQIAGRQAQAVQDLSQAIVHARPAAGIYLAELHNHLAQALGNMGRRVAAY